MTNSNSGLFASKKQAIEIIASNETYKNLSTFESVEEMNETVRHYKEVLADKLNKTQLAVLELLHNYSANEGKKNGFHSVGVSWLRKNIIAATLGKSRRTIIRVCQHLEALGIIRQYEMKRESDMYQTSNAIVIQPLPKEEKQLEKKQNVTQDPIENQQKMSHQKNNIYSLKQNIKTYKNRTANAGRSVYNKIFDKFSVSKWVPARFRDLMADYIEFQDSKVIEDFWRSVHILTFKDNTLDRDTVINLAEMSFVELTRKMSKGQVRNKPVSFFTGVMKRKINELSELLRFEETEGDDMEKFASFPFPTIQFD